MPSTSSLILRNLIFPQTSTGGLLWTFPRCMEISDIRGYPLSLWTGAWCSEVSGFHLTGGLFWYPRRSLADLELLVCF